MSDIEIPLLLPQKKKYYTENHKLAQQKYRQKNRIKYNENQRNLYEKLHNLDEWKIKFNERSKINNLIYRNKKKEEIKNDPNYIAPTKGRPRKQKENLIINLIIDVIKPIEIETEQI